MRDVLRRAEPGEQVILGSHALFPDEGPFREFGPIYVSSRCEPRSGAGRDIFEGTYFCGELVLRRYDERRWISGARRIETGQAAALVEEWLSMPATAFVDARFPEYGCFACRFVRATDDRPGDDAFVAENARLSPAESAP